MQVAEENNEEALYSGVVRRELKNGRTFKGVNKDIKGSSSGVF